MAEQATRTRPATFRIAESLDVEIDEPSDVTALAWLPAALSPTGEAQLVLAKEARLAARFLLDADGGGSPRAIALDERIVDACNDFSGLAVDPVGGRLDESASLAEIALLDDSGDLRDDRQLWPSERVSGS